MQMIVTTCTLLVHLWFLFFARQRVVLLFRPKKMLRISCTQDVSLQSIHWPIFQNDSLWCFFLHFSFYFLNLNNTGYKNVIFAQNIQYRSLHLICTFLDWLKKYCFLGSASAYMFMISFLWISFLQSIGFVHIWFLL